MGKSQRTKGAGYEREVVNILQTFYVDPSIGRELGQSRDGGGDIIHDGILWECKRRKRIAVYDWLNQASKAAEPLGIKPVVVARADHKESIVIMTLEHFLRMKLAP